MRNDLKIILTFVIVVSLMLLIWLLLGGSARAEDCPAGAKACKVVIMTPEEEQTLTGPNGVFEHAVWANRAGMENITRAWREKFQAAPAGKVLPPKDQSQVPKGDKK